MKPKAEGKLRKSTVLRGRHGGSCVKGRMQNIIVVPLSGSMFSQAVFFLRDDYFLTSDISRQELMRQAAEAAEDYVLENVSVSGRRILPVLALCFIAALFIAAYYFIIK